MRNWRKFVNCLRCEYLIAPPAESIEYIANKMTIIVESTTNLIWCLGLSETVVYQKWPNTFHFLQQKNMVIHHGVSLLSDKAILIRTILMQELLFLWKLDMMEVMFNCLEWKSVRLIARWLVNQYRTRFKPRVYLCLKKHVSRPTKIDTNSVQLAT